MKRAPCCSLCEEGVFLVQTRLAKITEDEPFLVNQGLCARRCPVFQLEGHRAVSFVNWSKSFLFTNCFYSGQKPVRMLSSCF